jgi:hypothetical protein
MAVDRAPDTAGDHRFTQPFFRRVETLPRECLDELFLVLCDLIDVAFRVFCRQALGFDSSGKAPHELRLREGLASSLRCWSLSERTLVVLGVRNNPSLMKQVLSFRQKAERTTGRRHVRHTQGKE